MKVSERTLGVKGNELMLTVVYIGTRSPVWDERVIVSYTLEVVGPNQK
jgi:hypothetical protein